MRNIHKVLTVLMLLCSITIAGSAQDKEDKKTQVGNWIANKNFTFVAQTALPQSGRMINLTTTYDLRVAADTVISDLPFFGRAFVAPFGGRESGLRFKSLSNKYSVKERKKGGWEITIAPKQGTEVRQMYLTVTESGYATLNVTSTNRQNINFNGYIKQG